MTDDALLSYKGNLAMGAGFIYAPYIPVLKTPNIEVQEEVVDVPSIEELISCLDIVNS